MSKQKSNPPHLSYINLPLNLQSTSKTFVINICSQDWYIYTLVSFNETARKFRDEQGVTTSSSVQADDLNFGSNLDRWTDSLGA